MELSITQALIALSVGAVLGRFFFGGLWLSAVHLVTHPRPWVVLVISLIVRFGVVLTGFYVLSYWEAPALLLSLAVFVVARVVYGRHIAARPSKDPETGTGGRHRHDYHA